MEEIENELGFFHLDENITFVPLEKAIPYNKRAFSAAFFRDKNSIAGDTMTQDHYVMVMNRFLVKCTEGSPHLYWLLENRTLENKEVVEWTPMSNAKMFGVFEAFKFEIIKVDSRGREIVLETNMFSFWKQHHLSRTITTFTFHPQWPPGFLNRINGDDEYIVYNKWTGFDKLCTMQFTTDEEIQMAEERIPVILFHLKEVISRGNLVIYEFLLEFLASIVQTPWKKIHVVPVISGIQGAGKSMFFEYFAKIFGNHGFCTPDSDLITHKFYGSELASMVFVVANETNFKNSTCANQLKNQITSDTRKSEKKFQDVKIQRDFVNMVWTSNDPLNSFPVERGTNRRYFTVEADGARANRPDYFTDLANAFEKDKYVGLRALYFFLKQRPLGNIDLNMPPHTEEKSDAIAAQFDDFETWWLKCLRAKIHHRGAGNFTFDPVINSWVLKGASKELLWQNFQAFLKNNNSSNWGNQTKFESEMKKILAPLDANESGAFAESEDLFQMPSWQSSWDYFHVVKGLVNPLKDTIHNRKRKLPYSFQGDRNSIRNFFRTTN